MHQKKIIHAKMEVCVTVLVAIYMYRHTMTCFVLDFL